MKLLKLVLREFGLILAFVTLGVLLLVSFWMTSNVEKSFLAEFRQDQVSVVIDGEKESEFTQLMQAQPEVLRFELQSPEDNRDLLASQYPELATVLEDLPLAQFPMTAHIVTEEGEALLRSLNQQPEIVQAQLVHRAPLALKSFLDVMTLVFGLLWAFTLVMFLYFQLDRLAFRDVQKWSLMKMLGAKATRIFWPVWFRQALRLTVAALLAVLVAHFVTGLILESFAWPWEGLSFALWAGFVALSVGLGSLFLYLLFVLKYRQVPLC